MLSEGAPLDLPDADSRRYLPYALIATVAVVVLPALVVLPLAPMEGASDVLVSALLAIGMSVAAGSAGAALWSRRPESRDVVFGDLMLWRWLRRRRAERHLADATLQLGGEDRQGDGDPLMPALHRLSSELEARDGFSRGHSRRVARHAERIAIQMGLEPDEVERIRSAALIHDVGNVVVPHSILMQRGTLSDDEREVVRQHSAQGAELVAELGDPELTAIVRHHHERVDGGGYPDGIAGDEIPLGARIVAVADTFDALTAPRPYRGPLSQRNALDVLSEEAGRQLDPAVVEAFLHYYSGKRQIAGVAFAATAPQRFVGWIAGAPAGVGASAPAIAQGVCTAGAVAIAGVCLGGGPALLGDRDGEAKEPQPVGQSAGSDQADAGTGGGAATDADRGGRDGRNGERDGKRGGPRSGDQAPASPGAPQTDGGGAPDGGAGGGNAGGGGGTATPRDVVQVPDPELPGVDTPDSSDLAPQGVLDPVQGIVDPVVDTVDQVLAPAPAPVSGLTQPVKKLLGDLGSGSPSP